MSVNRDRVLEALRGLDGGRALRRLLERVLGYDGEGGLISTDGWPEDVAGALAETPELFATAGREGRFAVVRVRLASSGKLSLMAERKVMERLRDPYPYALYAFSDAEERLWHFVNAPHGERVASKQYRRIVVGPGEGLRTATDRIAMLSVDDLADEAGKDPEQLSPLEIQAAHDEAFDVEAVTREFFREYRRVFEAVESSVTGIEGKEHTRFFVQRLFNRLMFVAFVEKKGWMRLNSRTDYLAALWESYAPEGEGGKGFYDTRLKPLFFGGLNAESEPGHVDPVIGSVPYLNGGLFEEDEDDRDERIGVPDGCLREILVGLFGRFNFTTTESTPLDTEVAVDPEMLGKVFEELVTGRHDVGAYYTPKAIVSFMCREALKGYLEQELGISEDAEREAIRAFVEEHDPEGLPNPEGALEALRSVRTCDPACGSGAYLLGMLRELLDLRESLFAAKQIDPRTTYQRKLEIIRENLYGVDIAEFAVNIARLRLWLSLVVDYEGERPPPLPNLEFKIEVGDSLLAPDPSGGLQLDFFREGQVAELFELKNAFLKAHGEDKKRLEEQIESLKQEITSHIHPDGKVTGFDWSVEFAEVFKEGGFDVIVANPPYVRQELIAALKSKLKEIFPEIYSGYADLYIYFYGRALQVLGHGGMLAFISPSKWFRADYGSKLRHRMATQCHVRGITDFGDLPVFQSATAYAMIFTAQRTSDADKPTAFNQVASLASPYPDVAAVNRQSAEHLPPGAIEGDDWLLTDEISAARLTTMKANGVSLGTYVDGQIFYGVKTGFNDAFIINGTQREELIRQDGRSAEIIKRFVVGKDVRKWTIDYEDRWLIFTRRGVDIARYPAIQRHLEQWRESLEPKPRGWPSGREWPGRKAGSYKWYEIQDEVAYHAEFNKPKIIYPVMVKSSRFAFDAEGSFANDKAFIIPLANFYLLGVLNSVPAWAYITEKCSKLRGGFYELRSTHLSKIPVPIAPETDQEYIAMLVRKCLDTPGMDCSEWEREIDERVAFLYGLSVEDLDGMVAKLRSFEESVA